MSERAAPRVTRPPPKLRTKTGCLTCRSRRKKCDEVKPCCKACQRNWLHCRWQSSQDRSRPSPAKSQQQRLSVELCSDNSLTLIQTTTEGFFDGLIESPRAQSEGTSSTNGDSVSSETVSMRRNYSDTSTQASSPASISGSIVYLPPGVNSTDDYNGMQYFISEMGPYMVRTHSHPGFFDHSYMVSLALHNPGLMESFLALSYVHRSAKDKKYLLNAMTHYNSAIRILRPLFEKGILNGAEDWLLMMMDIFCLIERWNTRWTSEPTMHLTALITVLKLRYAKRGASLFSSQIHTFERAMAESVLYQSVVLSLYKQMDDAIIGDISHRLQEAYAIDPFPDAPPWSNSPLLGFSPEVYNVIHRVLKLRRLVPLEGQDCLAAHNLYKDLCGLNLYSNVVTSLHDGQQELAKMRACCDATQLFLLATKIILLKIMNPEFQAGNACIQSLVEQALAILSPTQTSFFRYDQYLIWPLIVVGLASIHEQDVDVIRHSLQKVWDNTHCGDAKRGLGVLDRVSTGNGSITSEYESSSRISGLDILICKDGIFST